MRLAASLVVTTAGRSLLLIVARISFPFRVVDDERYFKGALDAHKATGPGYGERGNPYFYRRA
jgi:hypothetical protein